MERTVHRSEDVVFARRRTEPQYHQATRYSHELSLEPVADS